MSKQWRNLIAVLALLSFALYLAIQIAAPLYVQDKQNAFVVIEQGQGTRAIAQELEKKQLIRSSWFFQGYAFLKGVSHKLQAGEYDLSPSLSLAQILTKLATGDIAKETITVIEGWNMRDIAWHLQGRNMFRAEELFELGQKSFLAEYAFLQDKPAFVGLEGYLFPDTYHVRKGESLESVVKKMLTNFEKKYNAELRAETKRQGKTIFQIITMASLIEREVQTIEDKHIVSGILWKRLAKGIALQVDATVDYATGKTDSLYNTYQYPGLPLGPIANPGLESILAALEPTENPYLYYLSTPDGTTVFSKTLEEHNIAKAKYLHP